MGKRSREFERGHEGTALSFACGPLRFRQIFPERRVNHVLGVVILFVGDPRKNKARRIGLRVLADRPVPTSIVPWDSNGNVMKRKLTSSRCQSQHVSLVVSQAVGAAARPAAKENYIA